MSVARTERLTVAVSKDEAEYIRRTAEANDVTVSELIREIMIEFSS